MPDDGKDRGNGGLSLQTLLISSLSAVAAASVVPLFWEQGTLFATAMTPVIVALVSEALRKPAERITAVTPRVARRTATGAALRRFDPQAARTRRPERVGARGEGPERHEPAPSAPNGSPDDPFGLRTGDGRRRRPRLKVAIVTGLLAFFVAAVFVTVSELALFDGSVSGERGRTTIFGGQQRDAPREERPADEQATPEATPDDQAPEATPTPEGEATPEPSPTPTPTPPAAEATPPAPTPQPTP